MKKSYIIALDQGTTSSRAIIFDRYHDIYEVAQSEVTQIYPRPGWVEHDPMEIFATQSGVLTEVLAKSSIHPDEIEAIGITNQRETVIIWDKLTGKPIYNAIVWQCRRTSGICKDLEEKGYTDFIRDKTGLVLDAYFSATKIKWILDHIPGSRERARKGELLFGTVDSWLIYQLTGRKVHVTDVTNASRTMLFNIHTCQWDKELCELCDVPMEMLPEVVDSSGIVGETNVQGISIPIAGIAGDQQAALFGQMCFNPGEAKNTYGTGCFLLMNTGKTPIISHHGLVTTIAIGLHGQIEYALEGSIFTGGSIIQWLRDELGFFQESSDSEFFARKTEHNEGVYIVPAFTGLGAPYWNMEARGTITGLTRGTNRNHIIRAALEAIAYQSFDVLKAMEQDSGIQLSSLHVDGGASSNDFLMQFQADMLNIEINRPTLKETTALGAALLAGLATGFFESREQLKTTYQVSRVWKANMNETVREANYNGWHRAVNMVINGKKDK